MLYRLSFVIPVPMRSKFVLVGERSPQRVSWWQWRGGAYRIRSVPA